MCGFLEERTDAAVDRRVGTAIASGATGKEHAVRADRGISLYVVRPLRRIQPHRRALRVPILMYHAISAAPDMPSHPYFETTTTPQQFRRQMEALRQDGYASVPIEEAQQFPESSQQHPPRKRVVITFDDGYRDFYTNAFPVLQDYGFTACVFLPTAHIGGNRPPLGGRAHLTWQEVQEL